MLVGGGDGGDGGGQICNWKLKPVEQEETKGENYIPKFDLINAVHQSLSWGTAGLFFCTK